MFHVWTLVIWYSVDIKKKKRKEPVFLCVCNGYCGCTRYASHKSSRKMITVSRVLHAQLHVGYVEVEVITSQTLLSNPVKTCPTKLADSAHVPCFRGKMSILQHQQLKVYFPWGNIIYTHNVQSLQIVTTAFTIMPGAAFCFATTTAEIRQDTRHV